MFESWELEDRSSCPKQYGNRKKASDKRFYKRQANKAVRRYVKVNILSIDEEDNFEELLTLKAMLMAQRDMLIEKVEQIDDILNNLPI